MTEGKKHKKHRDVSPPKRSEVSKGERKHHSPSRSPPPRRRSPSRSPPPRRRSPSRSPPPRRRSPSRSPPPRRRSPSRSPPPRRRSPSRSPPPRRRSPSRSPPPRRRSPSRSPPPRRHLHSPRDYRRQRSSPPRRLDVRSPVRGRGDGGRSPRMSKMAHKSRSPRLSPSERRQAERELTRHKEQLRERPKQDRLLEPPKQESQEPLKQEPLPERVVVASSASWSFLQPHILHAVQDSERVEQAENPAEHYNGELIDDKKVVCEATSVILTNHDKQPIVASGSRSSPRKQDSPPPSPQRVERRRHNSPPGLIEEQQEEEVAASHTGMEMETTQDEPPEGRTRFRVMRIDLASDANKEYLLAEQVDSAETGEKDEAYELSPSQCQSIIRVMEASNTDGNKRLQVVQNRPAGEISIAQLLEKCKEGLIDSQLPRAWLTELALALENSLEHSSKEAAKREDSMCSPLADVGPGFEKPQSSPPSREESTRQSQPRQASVPSKEEETIEIDDDDGAETTAATQFPAQTMDDSQRSQRTGSRRSRWGGR